MIFHSKMLVYQKVFAAGCCFLIPDFGRISPSWTCAVGRAAWRLLSSSRRSAEGGRRHFADLCPWELGVSWNGSTRIAGWFISWKICLKWMMTGGTPILGKLQLGIKQEITRKHVDLRKQCQELVKNVEFHHEMGRQPWKVGESERIYPQKHGHLQRQVGIEFQP